MFEDRGLPQEGARGVSLSLVESAELFVEFALERGVFGRAGARQEVLGNARRLRRAGRRALRGQRRERAAAELRGTPRRARRRRSIPRALELERSLEQQENARRAAGVL